MLACCEDVVSGFTEEVRAQWQEPDLSDDCCPGDEVSVGRKVGDGVEQANMEEQKLCREN